MSSYPRNLHREAGLPTSFYWDDISSSSSDEPEVPVLDQAQSSRWSLSTAGTPLEGFFPSNFQSFSRSKLVASARTSNHRAKSSHDEPGSKRAFLMKVRRDDASMSKAKKPSLTVAVDVHGDRIDAKRQQSPVSSSSTSESRVCSPSQNSGAMIRPIENQSRSTRRKNSLGKIAHYPSKILGMILPKRLDSPKGTVASPKVEIPPLRRAETTIRRPRRSSELQRPDDALKRWSVASTQAIRAETFSFEHKQRSQKKPAILPLDTSDVHPLPDTIPPPLPLTLPPLSRSLTQPTKPTRGDKINRPTRALKRSRSERRIPKSAGPPVPTSREGVRDDSYLPPAEGPSADRSSETIAAIADRIVARQYNQYHHDSWDFLDYYTQSSNAVS
ncbi:hypothetical protein F5878DRAFT_723083 [Lentinula raphanica]|uniref:Uncharacterized protein n=1 Tax=Lentinula raphanica TaxID=153919 RepID=A0AA38UJZ1_9AGAR|nr:hypothetical protein C8R42DRAFT_727970 [Lentinula raphanica]KAJ3841277.1 hypothetical protein F5878DRAFT_723083 [Lentinula raphanica]